MGLFCFSSPATCDVHTLIIWGTIWLWGFRIRSWSSMISINCYTGRKLCKLKNVENWCGHFSWFGLKQSWSLKNSRISIISKMFSCFLVLKTAKMGSTIFWSNHWNFFEIYVLWEGLKFQKISKNRFSAVFQNISDKKLEKNINCEQNLDIRIVIW